MGRTVPTSDPSVERGFSKTRVLRVDFPKDGTGSECGIQAAKRDGLSMNDLKFAVRQLLKNSGFTPVAVLTLALGIGANAAMFSVVNAVLFKPIMAREPGRLAGLYNQEKENPSNFRFFSYLNYADLRASKEVFGICWRSRPGMSECLKAI